MPRRAAVSAARWAAKAVPFRAPLNPTVPALPEAMTFPSRSVRVIIVLLKVDWIYARPWGTDLRSRFRGLVFPRAIRVSFYFLVLCRRRPATVRLVPRLDLELVFVRCPRTGRPRR